MSYSLFPDTLPADQERRFMTKKTLSKQPLFQNATGPVTIPLTNDYLFKAMLQENRNVLKALVCSLLHFSPSQVKDATITNPIILGERVSDKMIILDVNISFNNGSRLNLEMQVVNEHNWPERSTIYACRNFSRLNKGSKYNDLKPVYQIGFLDYTLFPDHPSFYATYKLTDVKTHHVFIDKLSIRVSDLTNISLATEEDKRYNIDKWARLFKSQTWEEIKMLASQDVSLSDAAETIYQLSEDERIQQECEAREDFILRQQGMEDLISEQEQLLSKKDRTISKLQDENASQKQEIANQKQEIARLKALLASRE